MNTASERPPRISIITVVRNGRDVIEQTIQSVLQQDCADLEYIVIDGGSTDGTLDVIRRFNANIDRWISEPDKGIYDAMNKGVEQATGEWIMFLNAGDMFPHNDVLSALFREIPPDADVVYGGHQEDFGNGCLADREAGTVGDLWKGMVFSHQAMLVKTSILKRDTFNIANPIAADYEFIYSLYQKRCKFYRSRIMISRVLADGFSSARNLRLTLDQWRIARRFSRRTAFLDVYHAFKFIRVAFNNLLKFVLPKRLIIGLRSR